MTKILKKCDKNCDIISDKNCDIISDKNCDIISDKNCDIISDKNCDIISDKNCDIISDKNCDIISDKNCDIISDKNCDIISDKNCDIISDKDNIIQLCNIPNFIDINIIKKYVKDDIESNKEYFDDININYGISNYKKGEWIIYKSIKNSKLVSNGNNNVDIIIDNIGIDVSILTLSKNNTNEKSIMQNFTTSNNLDELFINKNGIEIVNIFRDKFINKIDKKFKKIYYIIFICYNKSIYLCSFQINVNNIKNMEFNSFSESCKSILLNNFIDKNIGNVILYKSKRRLELRIHKNILLHNNCINVY